MKISENGLALIKKFEGCKLSAYKCPAGVWTIGYGHTKGVTSGMTITQEEADELLKQDVEKYEDHVLSYDSIYNWNQNEFDSMVSFAFNLGTLRGVTNNGKRTKYQLAQHIQAYVYASGKKLNGLVNRRKAEYNLFMTPVNENTYEIGKEYKIVASGLNVRKEPTVNAPKAQKTALRKGTKIVPLKVVLDTDGNTWILIEKGYVAAKYKGEVYIK